MKNERRRWDGVLHRTMATLISVLLVCGGLPPQAIAEAIEEAGAVTEVQTEPEAEPTAGVVLEGEPEPEVVPVDEPAGADRSEGEVTELLPEGDDARVDSAEGIASSEKTVQEPSLSTQSVRVVDQGKCGTCDWTFYEDGLLVIGEGTLASRSEAPWPWSYYICPRPAPADFEPDSFIDRIEQRNEEPQKNEESQNQESDLDNNEVDYDLVITSLRLDGPVVAGESIGGLFSDLCVKSLDLRQLDVSQVRDMGSVFRGARLESLDVSNWDTSNVEDLSFAFYGCQSLKSLDLSSWRTPKLNDLQWAFTQCTSLSSLDVSGIDTSNVSNMHNVFHTCSALKSLDLSGWDTRKATNTNNMFWKCAPSEFTIGDKYDTSKDGAIPAASTEDGKWWSTEAKEWFTVEEIASKRSEIADTYLNYKPTDISTCTVTLSASSYTYDGKAKAPTVTVKDGTKTLAKDTDFTVSCPEAVNAGTYEVTVTGIGNYRGSARPTFKIAQASIAKATFSAVANQAWTGTEIKPAPTVKLGSATLKKGTDYTLSYKDNVAVGTATVTATGKGDYKGSASTTFNIVPKQVTPTATLSKALFTYNGAVQKPTVTVKDGATALKSETDYTLEWPSGCTNVGTYTVTATLKGNYTGEAKASFEIVAASISGATVSAIADQAWTGSAVTPVPTVTVGGRALKNKTDFTLKYADNVNVGTATVTITGKGNYKGTATKSFNIVKGKVTPTVTLSKTSFTYSGKAQKPTVTVKDGTTVLESGTDYTLSWSPSGCTDAGTYTVTATLKGNRSGTGKATFTIAPKSLGGCTPGCSPASYTYDGTQKAPKVTVKDGSTTLAANTHYTVTTTPSGRTNAGTYTYVLTGKGNYTGEAKASFEIVAASISGATVSAIASQTYTGKAITPKPTVTLGGKTLTSGTDYTLSYKNNTNAGTATVTATGKGNYTGTKSATFKIVKSSRWKFEWGNDNWNYLNSSQSGHFKSGKYVDQISAAYVKKLKANLTNIEKDVVFNGREWSDGSVTDPWIYEEWGGSCYGMSSTALLAKGGLLPYASYQAGAIRLSQLGCPTANMAVSSLVTYYQMLQVKDVTQQQYRTIPGRSHRENISDIISTLDRYGLSLIGFKKAGWGGHAILAYGYEYGSWTWDGVTYGGRIMICDPNASMQLDRRYDIYFNTSTYSWAIPAYSYASVRSASGARFNYVGADVSAINAGGYLGGTAGASPRGSYVARLDAPAISGDRSVTKVSASSGGYVDRTNAPGDIEEDYSYVATGEGEGTPGYNLRDADSAYRVTQGNAENLQLALRYEDCALSASSVAGRSATFDRAGYVEVTGETAAWSLSITSNEDYPTDWYAVSARGKSADRASMRKAEGGYVIAGDNLRNVTVEAHNSDESAKRTFSTSYGEAFVFERGDGGIGVSIDKDGNGSYETEIRPANPITVKVIKASISVTYDPKAATVTPKNVTVTNAQGAVTYANASTDATPKKFSVNKSTGKVTLPKATRAGTYTVKVKVTAAGNANYKSGSKTVSYKIVVNKAANPITATPVARTASYATLKTKAVTVTKPLTVSGSIGTKTYARAQNSNYFTVDKTTGKVTIKKGTPKGTYTLKVKVTAAGGPNYKAGSKTVTCKITVK